MRHTRVFLVICIVLLCHLAIPDSAQIVIPQISERLKIEDFLAMRPPARLDGKLAVLDGFVQSNPTDGAPSSQRTVVYLAYDRQNVYIVFVCFDSNPSKISASMTRRENFSEDEDWIEVYFDTFNDQRRAYCFSTNALGVQWDSRYSEASGASADGGHQSSFDALWYSDGRITREGYVVSMAIPFKSIRFPSGSGQTWRMLFGRSIPRTNEYVAWPHVSKQIQGMLTQSSIVSGLKDVSPGKSLQFIPYSSFRSFRVLDTQATPPHVIRDSSDPAAGLDAKLVLKDSFVFDLALNPDFSQVESDQPQVTVNQRFEVFFREKRPFFLENAQYFETPLNLVFTRRIADPQYGGRLTGKLGPYTLGVLFTDDQAPGKLAPQNSSLSGSDAHFGIIRFSRDILRQSYVGLLLTNRTLSGSSNTVAGADFRLRLNDQWQLTGQAVGSRSDLPEGSALSGSAYQAHISRIGTQFQYETIYNSLSPEFESLSGFIPRTDYRSIQNLAHYYFRPEGRLLVAWGPEFDALQSWDYAGTRLDFSIHPSVYVELQRRTFLRIHYFDDRQRLRPVDFPALGSNTDFATPKWRVDAASSFWKRGTFELQFLRGKDVNFFPAEGASPAQADLTSISASFIVRALQKLQFRNNYFFTELRTPDGATIFDDHIVRTRATYQFTRELSLRLILQYEATISNPALTSLEDRRNLNADLLITYLINPWTALYVGYNGNRQNLVWTQEEDGPRLVRAKDRFMNDANQFFLKFSYLFRF